MKTIVFTGPESTGKSWLAGYMAGFFNTTWLPEYLREYYDKYGISRRDMREVAKRQILHEHALLKHNQYPVLFFDTNIISLKVYHQFYYNEEPIWFDEYFDPSVYSHYILLDTDVPWIADPQRDSPKVREELFPLFEKELKELQVPYTLIGGDYQNRLEKSKEVIQQIIK